MCQSLSKLVNLQLIDLNCNKLEIHQDNYKNLSETLSKLVNLQTINLSSNKLGKNFIDLINYQLGETEKILNFF